MYSMIIVDDEIIEQRVLQKMVQDFCPNVELLPSVSNGAELIACLEERQPDLIVLDINMPVLNGLDVLEWIKLKGISVKILIVSAYSKFQYAQKCVNMGADGYILKPVNERKFVEMIDRLCAELDREIAASAERGSLEALRADYKKTLENEMISDLLLGEMNGESSKKYVQLLRRPLCGGGTCVIKHAGEGMPEEQTEKMLSLLNRFCSCFWKPYKNFCAICLLPDSMEQKGYFENWIEELFGYVKRKLPSYPWDTLIVGISSWKASFEDLPAAMLESRIAVRGVSSAGFYFYQKPERKIKEISFHREFHECRCLLCAESAEKVREAFAECWDKILKEGGGLLILRLFAFALLCAMDQEINGAYIFSRAHDRLDNWKELLTLQTPEELSGFVADKKIEDLSRRTLPAQTTRTYVEQCVTYLEGHYREGISLEMAAEKIGISSFYLSRLFKQERKKTFVEVLTDIRIGAALDLMWKSNESFQRITEQVGYDNVSYFYKLFKKKMVFSASEVRTELKKFL